jgi:hypothetical protein
MGRIERKGPVILNFHLVVVGGGQVVWRDSEMRNLNAKTSNAQGFSPPEAAGSPGFRR